MSELMAELLAVLFVFLGVVLRRLTKKNKSNLPPYATIKELDPVQLRQQELLEEIWIEHIMKFREVLILAICAYVLAEPVIDYFSPYFGG